MKKSLPKTVKSVYFIGVGGCFMSALAEFCVEKGIKVAGSDRESNRFVKKLKNKGVKVFIGHRAENLIKADAVVYTSAISPANPELLRANELNVPVFSRSEFLGEILKGYQNVVAVSGCHGKTTAACMIGRALIASGKNPTVFVGGEDKTFGNFKSGGNTVAVTEACEYKRNFFDIKPTLSVILNIGFDHADCYKNLSEVKSAYAKFSKKSLKIVNGDDINCSVIKGKKLTFGLNENCFYRAVNLKKGENGYSFDLTVGGVKKFRVRLNVGGKFNVYNALSAFAVADTFNCPLLSVKNAVEKFTSVKRRAEFLGEYKGKKIYADYAHHPDEISAVIPVFPKNSLFVFEPHTYSRTKTLKSEFVESLKAVDCVIFKTYPAREVYDIKGDGYTLYNSLKKTSERSVFYAKNLKKLNEIIVNTPADAVVILGAGELYDLTEKYFFDKKI